MIIVRWTLLYIQCHLLKWELGSYSWVCTRVPILCACVHIPMCSVHFCVALECWFVLDRNPAESLCREMLPAARTCPPSFYLPLFLSPSLHLCAHLFTFITMVTLCIAHPSNSPRSRDLNSHTVEDSPHLANHGWPPAKRGPWAQLSSLSWTCLAPDGAHRASQCLKSQNEARG